MYDNMNNIIPSSEELEWAKEKQVREMLDKIRSKMLELPNANMWTFWYNNTSNNGENLKEVVKQLGDAGYDTNLTLRGVYSESGHELLVYKKGFKPLDNARWEIILYLIKFFAIVGSLISIGYILEL